jgi:hypothetical protein
VTAKADAIALESNETLASILHAIESDARDALVSTPAEDTSAIRDQQALCRAVAEIRQRIRLIVLSNDRATQGPI